MPQLQVGILGCTPKSPSRKIRWDNGLNLRSPWTFGNHLKYDSSLHKIYIATIVSYSPARSPLGKNTHGLIG